MSKKLKLLLYTCKTKPYLNDYRLMENCNQFVVMNKPYNQLNGKIVAECDFEVENIYLNNNVIMGTETLNSYDLVVKSKVEIEQMRNYLKGKNGYAIHIKNLHIFDEPKELGNYKGDSKGNFFKVIEKAPQNMMYAYDNDGNKYIVISIKPQWMCLILNRIKDIEIRKKVLKEMIK